MKIRRVLFGYSPDNSQLNNTYFYNGFYTSNCSSKKAGNSPKLLVCLLLSGSILSPGWAAARSAGVVTQKHPVSRTSAPISAKSHSRHAAPRRTSLDAGAAETMKVSVQRNISHGAEAMISKQTMEQFAAGTSPMKMLARLPGIMFNSADPMGLDTWSSNLYMRGFTQAQLGVTLDGIPLGYQGYRTYNGLGINAAVISDNVESMSASQGGGALSVPSTTTLGGALQFTSSDPSDHRGGKVSQLFGSNSAFRTYVRLDSGALNSSGTKFYVSYMRNDSDKWKGSGPLFMQQVNAKLVQPVGASSKISAFFDWDQSARNDYADLSFNQLKTLGARHDYLQPDYRTAYLAAQGIYSAELSKAADPLGSSYYDGVSLETNYLGGLTFDFLLTDRLRWKTVAYGQGNSRQQSYTDPYMGSPNGSALSEEASEPSMQRFGLTSGLVYTLDKHTISSGVWYENNSFTMNEFMYQQPVLGEGQPLDAINGKFGKPFQENWGMRYNTNTFQYHLQDVWHPLHNLSVLAGFRSMLVTTGGGAYANDAAYNGEAQLPDGSMTSAAAFLPHVNIDWHFLTHHELYFDMAENMRAYDYGGYQMGSIWGVTNQATFTAAQHSVKPERAWVYNVGYRYSSSMLHASVSAYRANFSNRLQSLTGGTLAQPVSTVVNVGGVTMNGVDGSATIGPFKGVSITNSISYNHSTYDNNVEELGEVYAFKGKKAVNYPQLMYKANLTYTYKGLMAHFDATYTSKRYFSYLNDMAAPSFWMASVGARYNFGKIGVLRNLTADFNVYNLFNTTYIAQMGENGNPFSGDYQSLMIGAPRQFFGSVSASF